MSMFKQAMTYCDGCHDSDSFECGAEQASAKRSFLDWDEGNIHSAARRFMEEEIAEFEECGCPCSCHDGVVEDRARVAGGGT